MPDLAAKDVIDIQMTLDPTIEARMVVLGYTQPDGVWRDHCPATITASKSEWAKWFFRPPEGQHRIHTHVRVQGWANQRYPLSLGSWLC